MLEMLKAKKGVTVLGFWQILLIVVAAGSVSILVSKYFEFSSLVVWIGRIGFFIFFLFVQIRCNSLKYANKTHKVLFGIGVFFYMFFCSTKVLN